MSQQKIALITGSNRGIGLETARQLLTLGHRVLLGCRNIEKTIEALEKLSGLGECEGIVIDTGDSHTIDRATSEIHQKYGGVDILINNAGIFKDSRENGSPFETPPELLEEVLSVNTFGAFRLCQKLIPHMVRKGFGRVVNLSSGMGQLSEMGGGYASYRISKTALNAVTRIFSEETKGSGVLVNSVCPGWVKTDMGGAGADRPVEKGAETIVWLATDPTASISGKFFRDKQVIPW